LIVEFDLLEPVLVDSLLPVTGPLLEIDSSVGIVMMVLDVSVRMTVVSTSVVLGPVLAVDSIVTSAVPGTEVSEVSVSDNE